jgi:alpha-L-rhamnosidase
MDATLFAQAHWISSRVLGSPTVMAPAPYFRRSFTLKQPVRSAQLAITALGVYEAEINGQRVGDQVLAPGWTDYRKRVAYQVYDVTALLRAGENVLGAVLGDGWYCGYVAWKKRQFYGERPSLLAQLRVVLGDGTAVTVGTDSTWKTLTGPILENDLLKGEAYDARLELAGWSEPGYPAVDWQPVLTIDGVKAELVTSAAPPVRRIQELTPIAETRPGEAAWLKRVFDLGQNFNGRVRIAVRSKRGTTLIIRHAEMLQKDCLLYTENLRGARATDYYTCRGDGLETWEPRFTFHGFRYVEVEGLQPEETLELTGIVLHSDMAPTGSFECSAPMLNQLQHNIVWGQKSNFLDVPTDCPQRDERLGWTGDAQVFIRTACFNSDVRGFFYKWMQDMRDAQKATGALPPVVPDPDATDLADGGPAWSDAIIICPWTIYLCYGDQKILEDHYDAMRRYMDFLHAHRCKDHIRSHPDVDPWGGFGDWLALDGGPTEGRTPKDLIGTALYAYVASLMVRMSKVLGFEEQAQGYERLHGEIGRAFQHRFVTPAGLLAADTQTAYVLALQFGLIPGKTRPAAVGELVRMLEKAKYHIATGFVGTPYILDVLETHGRLDLAYKLVEQETFPSWLFPVKNGATTIWERWDGWTPEKGFQDKGMNSFNHYAYGAVGAWMYRTIAGLELDPDEPGYRHIVFRPRPGGSITWAKAHLVTPQGEAGIHWELMGETLQLKLEIPAGSWATVDAPEGYAQGPSRLGSGVHEVSLCKE